MRNLKLQELIAIEQEIARGREANASDFLRSTLEVVTAIAILAFMNGVLQ